VAAIHIVETFITPRSSSSDVLSRPYAPSGLSLHWDFRRLLTR
jgi:hypothetical protein